MSLGNTAIPEDIANVNCVRKVAGPREIVTVEICSAESFLIQKVRCPLVGPKGLSGNK